MRILVTGATGRLGSYVSARLDCAAHDFVGWGRRAPIAGSAGQFEAVDLADAAGVARALGKADPEVVIHLAAISSAEEVRRDPRRAWEINVAATRQLAAWAIRHDRRLIFSSSDLVFDGAKSWYREDDYPNPILEYGRMKRAGELAVSEGTLNLTARLSLLYGIAPAGREGFFDRSISSMRAGRSLEFFDDEHRTPLDYATAALVLERLAETLATGLIHVGGPERLSRFELMRRSAHAFGIDPSLVQPSSLLQQHTGEARPADVSLDTTRLRKILPELTIPTIEKVLQAHAD